MVIEFSVVVAREYSAAVFLRNQHVNSSRSVFSLLVSIFELLHVSRSESKIVSSDKCFIMKKESVKLSNSFFMTLSFING